MKDCIRLWIPLDTNVNSPSYTIPKFENQKDLFVAMLAPNPNEEAAPPVVTNNYNNQKDQKDLIVDDLTKDWVDIMSFSHNVASEPKSSISNNNNNSKPHIGKLTMTKFTCDRTPSFNYLTLRRELIPHIVHRVIGKLKGNELPIIEYEMHHCSIDNASISGGAGGKPVETITISGKVMILKHIGLDVSTGEYTYYQVCKWDTLKNSGGKTIRKCTNGISNGGSSLLDLAKKRLIIDLDSQDPSMVKLLKDLDIVSEYELPEENDENEPVSQLYKVLINKDPALFELIDLPSGTKPTIDIFKKLISEQLNIPLDTIKNLFNYQNGILVNNPKILKITTSFIVQTTDGKFYGHH